MIKSQLLRVREIYRKYKIPPNLSEHLLRVAKVAAFIGDHWTGPKIDTVLIKKVCLLHDLGNIVKFDFENHPEFLGEETEHIDHWRQVQKEIAEKYGADDHEATTKMLSEIGVGEEVENLAQEKRLARSPQILGSKNWELKIIHYADARAGPFGIVSLEERLADVWRRYGFCRLRGKLARAYRAIEKQIQANLDLSVSEINDESVKRGDEEFLELEI